MIRTHFISDLPSKYMLLRYILRYKHFIGGSFDPSIIINKVINCDIRKLILTAAKLRKIQIYLLTVIQFFGIINIACQPKRQTGISVSTAGRIPPPAVE